MKGANLVSIAWIMIRPVRKGGTRQKGTLAKLSISDESKWKYT